MEEWRDIEGYEGLYQISSLGRVKSFPRHTTQGGKLKINKIKGGYCLIKLCKNGKTKRFYVHRLVAQAFISNPNNLPMINHKDENPSNNNVDNLEWCDCKYNNMYGTRLERISKSKSIPIYCLETNKIYKSAIECAKELNIRQENIVHVLKGRAKQTKGYTFRYANKVL